MSNRYAPEEPWRTEFLRYWLPKALTAHQSISSAQASEVYKAGWDAALQHVINKLENRDE